MDVKRLNDKINIDIWKKIADRVQMLNIYDFSDREFMDNLHMLRDMVSDLDISLDYLSRYPDSYDDVGLASLLQSIYDGDVYNDYKKANFYEKIYQLDDLGVSWIRFCPVSFPSKIENISLFKDDVSGKILGINKCFTDGDFRVDYVDSPLDRRYDLINLRDANYIFNVLLSVDNGYKNEFANMDDVSVVLKNFNGKYPSKDSILEVRYPGLCTYYKDIPGDSRRLILKQIYQLYDTRDVNYPKKLMRVPNNYHYE